MKYWLIETKDENNKKIEIKLFSDLTWQVISAERPIDVKELNELFSMTDMMFKSQYIHMECTIGQT